MALPYRLLFLPLHNSHQVSGGWRALTGGVTLVWTVSLLGLQKENPKQKKKRKIQFSIQQRTVSKAVVATNPENVSTLQTVYSQPNACTTAVIDLDKEINIHKDDWSHCTQEVGGVGGSWLPTTEPVSATSPLCGEWTETEEKLPQHLKHVHMETNRVVFAIMMYILNYLKKNIVSSLSIWGFLFFTPDFSGAAGKRHI